MPNAELKPEQAFALIDELETAAKLTQCGMDALHDLDAANDFHHLPMQLLSQGFERLLKVTYALAVREHSGELPTVAEFKRRYGYDLTKINSALIELVASNDEYANRPAVRDDLDFLSTDPDLARVLKLLSSFGTWSRYYTSAFSLTHRQLQTRTTQPWHGRQWSTTPSKACRMALSD